MQWRLCWLTLSRCPPFLRHSGSVRAILLRFWSPRGSGASNFRMPGINVFARIDLGASRSSNGEAPNVNISRLGRCPDLLRRRLLRGLGRVESPTTGSIDRPRSAGRLTHVAAYRRRPVPCCPPSRGPAEPQGLGCVLGRGCAVSTLCETASLAMLLLPSLRHVTAVPASSCECAPSLPRAARSLLGRRDRAPSSRVACPSADLSGFPAKPRPSDAPVPGGREGQPTLPATFLWDRVVLVESRRSPVRLSPEPGCLAPPKSPIGHTTAASSRNSGG
jgi:hypothetical protein